MNGKIIKSMLPCLSRRCQTLPPTWERLPWLSLKCLCPLQSPIMLPKHTLGLRLLHQVFRNLPLGGPTCSIHSLKSSRQLGHLVHWSRHGGSPWHPPNGKLPLLFLGLAFMSLFALHFPCGHQPKESTPRKTNTVWYHLRVESKKYSKLVNITKQQQARR